MGKSRNGKNHKQRLAAYKIKKKQDQERFKKMMYDNYIRAQQEYLASQESHKETEEQEVDIDTGDFNLDIDINDNIIIDDDTGESESVINSDEKNSVTTGTNGPKKPTGIKRTPKGK